MVTKTVPSDQEGCSAKVGEAGEGAEGEESQTIGSAGNCPAAEEGQAVCDLEGIACGPQEILQESCADGSASEKIIAAFLAQKYTVHLRLRL